MKSNPPTLTPKTEFGGFNLTFMAVFPFVQIMFHRFKITSLAQMRISKLSPDKSKSDFEQAACNNAAHIIKMGRLLKVHSPLGIVAESNVQLNGTTSTVLTEKASQRMLFFATYNNIVTDPLERLRFQGETDFGF